MLKLSALPLYLFRELLALCAIRFTHREKANSDVYARAISANLQRPFPVHRNLTAPVLLWNWEEDKVRKTLDLVDIRKCRVIVCAKDLSQIVSEPNWSRERWYGTQYRIEPLDSTVISACLEYQPMLRFSIPRPNQFIPEIIQVDHLDAEPREVRHDHQ